MFVHCIKPSSSIMYNLWKWSDCRGRKSCIDRRAQHGRHVPTLVGQCGIDKYVTYLREISMEHDVRRYKRIFFNTWPIVVWCQPQMSTLFCFGKSRIGIRSKRHHQILNDHSPKGPLIAYTYYSLQNKCRTADPDRQNLGRSGKLSFFIIYKFWQNCASVRQVSDLILKTAY